MGRKYFAVLFISALYSACSDPLSASLAPGVYPVITVDGRPLPAELPVMGRGSCSLRTLYRSEFAFGLDSTFEQRFWFSADPSEKPAVFRTSYVQRGTSIEISEGSGTGSFRLGTLRIEMPITQICESLTWEAVLRRVRTAT